MSALRTSSYRVAMSAKCQSRTLADRVRRCWRLVKCDERLRVGSAPLEVGLNGLEALGSQSEPAATLKDFN